ncbi:signal peptidase I [Actinomyces polynesiensis]|uniref:signal peptidase I n=1 Tax=Actinomyces polynesiensis TaxID=1325934 RepID=UPI0009E39E97|nr:signal peptidase I [Actinomyces polynesiensis]
MTDREGLPIGGDTDDGVPAGATRGTHIARDQQSPPPRRRGGGRAAGGSGVLAWLREVGLVLLLAVILSSLLRAFVVQVFWIPSPSMHDTLVEDDRIAVSRVSAWTGDIHRGDVVVFNDSLGWLPTVQSGGAGGVLRDVGEFIGFLPADGEQTLVKRVIGVGGDHVTCCTAAGRIEVNGVAIDEPYLAPGQAPSTIPFDVVVPEGHLWVMGDNRGNSSDSRYHMTDGQTPFVSLDDVVGRAMWVIWPVSHWSSLGGREVFDKVPEP